MTTHSDSLVLFAVGNSGANGNNTVATPSLSKNSLSVGASMSYYYSGYPLNYTSLAYFSSQGPTHDGRIKPEVREDCQSQPDPFKSPVMGPLIRCWNSGLHIPPNRLWRRGKS